ncbi:MAG: DNA repair protein RadA [Treponema sp.]
MAKKKTEGRSFRCSSCGYSQPKWLGRCPSCGEWNSFEEQFTEARVPAGFSAAAPLRQIDEAHPVPLAQVEVHDTARISTGIPEFDRVLGGGAVKRSAVLIGGEPGIGKSTLLLQAAASACQRVLYVSGEESAGQIRGRADRLGVPLDTIELLCTNSVENIEKVLNKLNPLIVIIDSVQTLFSPQAGAIPGTINQLKYCAHELVQWVKERDAVLFLTAHVTKEGVIAGPKVLEHLVDTVISFERNEDDVRFLRALKNRFGSVDELGIFQMDERGLAAVQDPASLFIIQRKGALPAGSATVPIFEGSRVFMVEIQALTVPAKGAMTRVFSDKIDSARVSRIAAVIEKRIGLRFSDQDIYINVAGGIRLREPAVDLALALALYSARTDIPAQKNQAFIGELSLAGEIRPVRRLKPLIKTAQSLGFTALYTPLPSDGEDISNDIPGLFRAENLSETIKLVFGTGNKS